MENISAVTSFILKAYTELEDHRYLYSLCFLILYILIILGNSVLIAVISIERSLHGPMYLFICSLSVNGLYGSTCLFTSLLTHLLSRNYEISLAHCLLQLYNLHSYATIEFAILAAMSYDRYAAICHPLHYHLLMSRKKQYAAITLSWVLPLIYNSLLITFTMLGTFCGRIIEKVYCTNFQVAKLSCFDTTIQNYVGLAAIFIAPTSQIVLILFSYAQILRICLFASKESQIKALQTCTPHLLTVINYSLGCIFEIIQSRFNMTHIPPQARIFMSLYFLIIPPFGNPVIYGISIQAIRVQIFKLFCGKKNK